MALRFRSRHVHESCIDHITTGLTALGWTTPPINFGTTPITVIEYQPTEAGVTVNPNTVAISMGDEPDDLPEELGAGLETCDYTLFADVYGITASMSMSIAGDIKSLLKNKIIPLRDYTLDDTGTPTTNSIEFDTVIIDIPIATTTGPDKRFWRAVKATARLYFVE
jgi:hypothetical protein